MWQFKYCYSAVGDSRYYSIYLKQVYIRDNSRNRLIRLILSVTGKTTEQKQNRYFFLNKLYTLIQSLSDSDNLKTERQNDTNFEEFLNRCLLNTSMQKKIEL
jgi:hypothetical protein